MFLITQNCFNVAVAILESNRAHLRQALQDRDSDEVKFWINATRVQKDIVDNWYERRNEALRLEA